MLRIREPPVLRTQGFDCGIRIEGHRNPTVERTEPLVRGWRGGIERWSIGNDVIARRDTGWEAQHAESDTGTSAPSATLAREHLGAAGHCRDGPQRSGPNDVQVEPPVVARGQGGVSGVDFGRPPMRASLTSPGTPGPPEVGVLREASDDLGT
jgi:hypothetical protein